MNKYIKIIPIFLLIFSSCNTESTIELKDLYFGDVEREYIADNKIDTMFLISDNYDPEHCKFSDTFMLYIYDTNGRLLFERKRCWWGHTLRLEYDSIGLVKYRVYCTDFLAEFYPTYKYIPEKRLLYQYWYQDRGEFWRDESLDTCFFIFDKKGRVIESEEYTHNNYGSGRYFKTIYTYNSERKLQNRTEMELIPIKFLLKMQKWTQKEWEEAEYWIKEDGIKISTEYYYTNGKIDSTITTHLHLLPKYDYISKTYYDNNGLRIKTIEKDSITINYGYTKRK